MPETEFNAVTLSDAIYLDTDCGDYDFLFGYSKKDFGADSFYSNLFPNEGEHTDTRFFKLEGSIESGVLRANPKLFLRRHRDKFALDRNRPGWQTNYHTTYTYGHEMNFVVETPLLDVAYGYELSRDTIDSTSMQAHQRLKNGLYVELSPHLIDRLHINIGMREDYFSDFGWECAPSAGCRYALF